MRSLIAVLLVAAIAAGCASEEASTAATGSPSPTIDPCIETEDPELLLACERFSQRPYWLGEEMPIGGADDLLFTSSYIDDGDKAISPRTRLVIVYDSDPEQAASIYLTEWHRPAWDAFTADFSGYDPSVVPAEGPINWWQHPCVQEEVYSAQDGAEVHLFRAHLMSLIYIPPMTAEEVSQCLDGPVGAFGAHVYFEETVIEFSVQDQVSPTELEPPVPVGPGGTPLAEYTPAPLPTYVLVAENPYNDEDIVRQIVAALRPYEP